MILPGDRVRWGEDILTVGAVGLTGGERYVWLVDAAEVVTMVPAADVEKVER